MRPIRDINNIARTLRQRWRGNRRATLKISWRDTFTRHCMIIPLMDVSPPDVIALPRQVQRPPPPKEIDHG